jgi:UDPglucose--hexose-1-phosphate uridylyltransferase
MYDSHNVGDFLMVCNEIRKDYLLNRWVVIATERSRRPTDFIKSKATSAKEKTCPLCVGNEALTPPAVLLYLNEKGKIIKDSDNHKPRKKNWIIRVVPNLYPAFSSPLDGSCNEDKRTANLIDAKGHHEVLVESTNHDEDLSSMKLEQLINLIEAYIDRLNVLGSKPYVKHVAIFRNYGKEAGASLTHAHSQIIAMPILPRIIEEEIIASKNFYNKNKKCVFCDIIENEKKGPRLIFQNKGFVVFAPYASIQPLEFWIVPKKHNSTLLNLTKSEKTLFAESIKKSLSALRVLVNDPPYNYGFHISINKKTEKYYHWHLEVYPKLSVWAGFEKSTGIYINTVPPEVAALELSKIIEK